MAITEAAAENIKALADNPYPGRGIVLGVNDSGDKYVQVYWLMGRSPDSRNRVFERDEYLVRTAPFDESKMKDPSLIIYNAMRRSMKLHVVTNGDQTDTIINGLIDVPETDFEVALEGRKHEPDAPNFTPRISGLTDVKDDHLMISQISRTSQDPNDPDDPEHAYYYYGYSNAMLPPGFARCIQTYEGDPGNGLPLPPFSRRPYAVLLGETIDEIAQRYFGTLNPDNFVALVVKTIGKENTNDIDFRIINKNQPVTS